MFACKLLLLIASFQNHRYSKLPYELTILPIQSFHPSQICSSPILHFPQYLSQPHFHVTFTRKPKTFNFSPHHHIDFHNLILLTDPKLHSCSQFTSIVSSIFIPHIIKIVLLVARIQPKQYGWNSHSTQT